MNTILGLNSAYHELAACVLQEGVPVAFAEEERFSRRKHGKPARVDNADELPWQAMDYCLRQAGLKMAEVDAIAYSFNPPKRLRNLEIIEPVEPGSWGSQEGEERFQSSLQQIPAALEQRHGVPVRDRFHWVDHHLCHAASAYLVSPFEEAAVLAIDGIAEFATAWLGHGQGSKMRQIAEIDYPHSLGFLWEKMSQFLGFSEYDACKIMALGSHGDAKTFAPVFSSLIQSNRDGGLRVAADVFRFRAQHDFAPLEKLLGPRRVRGEALAPRHADIAAALQKSTDRALLDLAAFLRRATGSDHLCLAGGVALNCVSNRILQESGLFAEIYIQPAANDAGTALGAALTVWCQQFGGARASVFEHPYLGPDSEAEMLAALAQSGLPYHRSADVAAEAAERIAGGAVLGWFQGRMEAGPRALGNRSLLADPRRAEMREVLNSKVKHREKFQPFAPAILAPCAGNWFRIPGYSRSSDFMLFAWDVRPEQASRIPAVVHVDGTARVQTVQAETNPRFYQLISEFERRTGVPLVLNTSFNDSEPIVCSPTDALRTFQATRIDVIVLGDFVVERPRANV